MSSVTTLDWLFAGLLGLGFLLYLGSKIYQIHIRRTLPPIPEFLVDRLRIPHLRVAMVRSLVYFLITVCVVLVLVFPITEEQESENRREGVDVLFLVDVSLSMNAIDASPSRLTRTKEVILQVLPELEGNRLGIIAFAGSPFLYCPLTTDLVAFSDYVRGLDVDMVGDKGTDFRRVLEKAKNYLQTDRIYRNRIVVLVSDGEDQENARALELGADLFVWAIGTDEGAPIFYNDSETKTNGYVTRQGGLTKIPNSTETILSRANHDFLRELAKTNRGKYFDLTQNGSLSYRLVDHIQEMEKNQMEMAKQILHSEKTFYFLYPAIALFLFDFFVLEYFLFRKSRRHPRLLSPKSETNPKAIPSSVSNALLILSLTSLPFDSIWAENPFNPGGSRIQSGVDAFQSGDYPRARQEFERSEQYFPPNDPRLEYNKGSALLKEGNPKEAIVHLENSIRESDPSQNALSYYNLGKAYSQLGDKKKAMDSYRRALQYHPEFAQAKKNLELLFQNRPPSQNPTANPPPNPKRDSHSDSDNTKSQQPPSRSESDSEPDNPSLPSPGSEKNPGEIPPKSQTNSREDSSKNREGRSELSESEAEKILEGFQQDKIQRKKSPGFFQRQRDKFW